VRGDAGKFVAAFKEALGAHINVAWAKKCLHSLMDVTVIIVSTLA
jgi:hypothetical protein